MLVRVRSHPVSKYTSFPERDVVPLFRSHGNNPLVGIYSLLLGFYPTLSDMKNSHPVHVQFNLYQFIMLAVFTEYCCHLVIFS